jgi:Spy/CpxP family protein refolding chaperone
MRALRSLNLSDSQKTQIRSIVQNYRQKDQGVDLATRRANSQQMRADIMNVLTPAQRTQFDQTVQQMRQQYQNQGGQTR